MIRMVAVDADEVSIHLLFYVVMSSADYNSIRARQIHLHHAR